jgi:hypothetical protein
MVGLYILTTTLCTFVSGAKKTTLNTYSKKYGLILIQANLKRCNFIEKFGKKAEPF